MSNAGPLRRTIPTRWGRLGFRYEASRYGPCVCRRTWPPNVDTETPQEVRAFHHAERRAVSTPCTCIRGAPAPTARLGPHFSAEAAHGLGVKPEKRVAPQNRAD